MVRVLACHAKGCGFESHLSRKSPFRLMVRTSPFHGANMGSIPIRDVNEKFNIFSW